MSTTTEEVRQPVAVPEPFDKKEQPAAAPDAEPDKTQVFNTIIESKTHFEALRLPFPYPNDADLPEWPVDEAALKKAYRQLSLLTHPDKNFEVAKLASDAFDRVRQAFNVLSNPDQRDPYVKEFTDNIVRGRAKGWKPGEKNNIESELQRIRQSRELKKKELESVRSKLMAQTRQRLANPANKRTRPTGSSASGSDAGGAKYTSTFSAMFDEEASGKDKDGGDEEEERPQYSSSSDDSEDSDEEGGGLKKKLKEAQKKKKRKGLF